jgi:hypothetical protein
LPQPFAKLGKFTLQIIDLSNLLTQLSELVLIRLAPDLKQK